MEENDSISDADMDQLDDLPIIDLLIPLLPSICQLDRQPYHDSILTGHAYYLELMARQNVQKFIDATRMRKETFLTPVDVLVTHTDMKSTSFITCGERLMMSLDLLKGHCLRTTAERFQHSIAPLAAADRVWIIFLTVFQLDPVQNQNFLLVPHHSQLALRDVVHLYLARNYLMHQSRHKLN
jgi:hypothetical protein